MANKTELIEDTKKKTRYLEEDLRFLHDKLITLSSAIMAFTAIMLGNEKIQGFNLILLKSCWCFLGCYLIFALASIWASFKWKSIMTLRSIFIETDKKCLEGMHKSTEKDEMLFILDLLNFKEVLEKSTDKKNYEYFKKILEKHKNNLKSLSFLKKMDFDNKSFEERIMVFFVINHKWSYVLFVLGILSLMISVF